MSIMSWKCCECNKIYSGWGSPMVYKFKCDKCGTKNIIFAVITNYSVNLFYTIKEKDNCEIHPYYIHQINKLLNNIKNE